MSAVETMERTAVISDCGTWRYRLGRRWADGPTLCWVMLNPSTADALEDDPTIRRCIGFARRDGYGAIDVINMCAYRATKPEALLGLDYQTRTGPHNRVHWTQATSAADRIVAAWGAWPDAHPSIERTPFYADSDKVVCLGTTKSGAPKHPLYVKGDTPFVPYPEEPHDR